METFNDRCDLQLLNDFLRCVDENYYVYEVYPSLGMYKLYDTPFDMHYKLMKIISCGAKGINFWQYRSERVGSEADCAGLSYMNGEKRPVLDEVKEVGNFIKKYDDILVKGKKKLNEVAILYDFDSMLLSEIEDSCGVEFSFEQKNPIKYYLKAHQGLYRLLTYANYGVDYISTSNFKNLDKYKVVFVPYLSMLTEEISNQLENFVKNGGTLILEEGFGLRTPNTWVEPYNIKVNFMDCWLDFRIKENKDVFYNNTRLNVGPYCTTYRIKGAKTLLTFDDKNPALQLVNYKKGKVYSFGFSLGYGAYENQDSKYLNILKDILDKENIDTLKYACAKNGIEENRLYFDDKELLFLFNNGNSKKTIKLKEDLIENCSNALIKNKKIILQPKTCGVVIVKE